MSASGFDSRPRLGLSGICQICGCTDEIACPGGCAWTDEKRKLCTACAQSMSLMLVSNLDRSEAILYVYLRGEFFRNAIGRAETLRAFAADHYPGVILYEPRIDGWFEIIERSAA